LSGKYGYENPIRFPDSSVENIVLDRVIAGEKKKVALSDTLSIYYLNYKRDILNSISIEASFKRRIDAKNNELKRLIEKYDDMI
jgi:hypothetical protein